MRWRPILLCYVVIGSLATSGLTARGLGRFDQSEGASGITETGVGSSLTAEDLSIYKNAPTLIDWTEKQIHESPFLHRLRPASKQDMLPEILEGVGRAAIQVFDDFPNVLCDERVTSEASESRSRVEREFNYIVLRRTDRDLPEFNEYRTDLKGNPVGAIGLWDFPMITSDFASAFLIMSPADQRENHYRYFGSQTIRGRECQVVGFAQDPATAHRIGHFSSYKNADDLPRPSAVILVQGFAWIDSQSFQTLRVATWLLAPRPDLGLSSQVSTIDFYPVRPTGTARELWMPRDVKVEILYRGIRIRNVHRYSNFRLFRVESTIHP